MTHLMILFLCTTQTCARVDSYESEQCDSFWMKPLDMLTPERTMFTTVCTDLPDALPEVYLGPGRSLNADQHRLRVTNTPTWGPRK